MTNHIKLDFVFIFLVLALVPFASAGFGYNSVSPPKVVVIGGGGDISIPTCTGDDKITSSDGVTLVCATDQTGAGGTYNVTYDAGIPYWYNHTSAIETLYGMWFYNMTTAATDWVTAQGYLTSVADNSTLIAYQNITNLPTCSGTDKLTFDGSVLSCDTDDTGVGGGTYNVTYDTHINNDTRHNDTFWYNHTSAIENLYGKWFYNMTTPFTNWLSTFYYDYNQTTATYDLYNDAWTATYNVTYDNHINNDTRHNNTFWYNHTSAVETLYGKWFYNMTTATYDLYNAVWTATYNVTYHDFVTSPDNKTKVAWTNVTSRPADCSAGNYVTGIDGATLDCAIPSGINNGHTHALNNLTAGYMNLPNSNITISNFTVNKNSVMAQNLTFSANGNGVKMGNAIMYWDGTKLIIKVT